MVIFLSVSLLLFLWVSSKCFLSVTVAFLSLMFWLAWASCWLWEKNKTGNTNTCFPTLPFSARPHSQTYLRFSLSQQKCKVKDVTSAHCCISASRCFICLIVFSHWWMSCCVSRWTCCKFSVVLSKAICEEDRRKTYSHRHCDGLWPKGFPREWYSGATWCISLFIPELLRVILCDLGHWHRKVKSFDVRPVQI